MNASPDIVECPLQAIVAGLSRLAEDEPELRAALENAGVPITDPTLDEGEDDNAVGILS